MRRIAVVDLDGTYLRCNSLHLYIRIGVARMLRLKRVAAAAQVVAVIAARVLRLTSHAHMKFAAASAIGWDEDLSRRMCATARHKVNPDVAALISQWQSEGCDIVIATAAFEFYARDLVPYRVIGTALHGNDPHAECRGIAKAERVSALATTSGAALHAVVTDSLDDLPLLSMPFSHKYYVRHRFSEIPKPNMKIIVI